MTEHPLLRMRQFTVRELIWETADIFTLVLEPPEGETIPPFQAGQWMYLHPLEADGTSACRAAFSIASAPEDADCMEFGIKVHGHCTRRLSELVSGDTVGVQGPFGVFTIPPDVTRIGLFAGGIGISPLRSMIRSLWLRRAPVEIVLFFSNRLIEDTPYYDELRHIAEEWPPFRSVFILTRDTPKDWEGETGHLNAEMVGKHAPEAGGMEWYMCGPPSFMKSADEILSSLGVETAKHLHKELFG